MDSYIRLFSPLGDLRLVQCVFRGLSNFHLTFGHKKSAFKIEKLTVFAELILGVLINFFELGFSRQDLNRIPIFPGSLRLSKSHWYLISGSFGSSVTKYWNYSQKNSRIGSV